MDSPILLITLGVIIPTSALLFYQLRVRSSRNCEEAAFQKPANRDKDFDVRSVHLTSELRKALPDSIISCENTTSYKKYMNVYWAQQACEVAPACFVRPRNVAELSKAIVVLKQFHETSGYRNQPEGLFAVRSGGHSPVVGASSINGGALIDLSLFNAIVPSDDGRSAAIGTGCKWLDVSDTLASMGLAVVGGRNSAVGVGGLTLGGGVSFFSPRFGFVCSNIIEYEIVLADGSIVTASKDKHADLWRALKGGSNNFGIVTRFTARTFPSTSIWGGFLYLLPFQAPKVLVAFQDFVQRIMTNDEGKVYDEYAAGPLACFTYLQQLGIQAIAVSVIHTALPESNRKWPKCWESSGFSRIWRLWNTCKVQSLTSATDEMSVLNPPGRRQEFATTTVKNDLETLRAAHDAYKKAIQQIKRTNIKNMSWTLVLQPLIPDWARKGDANALGLEQCDDEPLVIVSFTVNWALEADDDRVQQITRAAIEEIDLFAAAHHTSHRYRYLNYCGKWQQPFEGYGKNNHDLLKETSKKYDPEGLFQTGCTGGFKLGLD